ncbi:MAG: hypothetical protein V4623_06685, partial [Pseudomonadota bacterium]
MSDTLSNIESAAGAAQFVATQIARFAPGGGVLPAAIATYLLGEVSWTTRVTDLAAKLQNGTATGEDVAQVFSSTASVLASFGVLALETNPAFLTATGVAAALLFLYGKFVPKETKESIWNSLFSTILENEFFKNSFTHGIEFTCKDPRLSPLINTLYQSARTFIARR